MNVDPMERERTRELQIAAPVYTVIVLLETMKVSEWLALRIS